MNVNFNMPDFKNLKNTLSRVVQLTEEKLGTSEKTEFDANFENLAERAESARTWTEKIVKNTEAVLIPNPGNRVEDFIFEKIEKKKPTRLSNYEYLGLDMIEAGGEFGQDGDYGRTLIKVGQAEQKLGQCERDFIGSAGMSFVQPLKKFLDGEMRTIIKEKGLLETKRLDLDACKNRVKKSRSLLGQQAAERDLRVAQSEFDRQAEITKLLLEGISTTQSSHLRHLHSFVESQVRYFNQCVEIMNSLQRDLSNMGGPMGYVPIGLPELDALGGGSGCGGGGGGMGGVGPDGSNNMRRARVLCSYDASGTTELNLTANEVIFVSECSPPNPDYMYGKQGLLKGLVPKAFLEMLDDE